jgi:hypothetical protein
MDGWGDAQAGGGASGAACARASGAWVCRQSDYMVVRAGELCADGASVRWGEAVDRLRSLGHACAGGGLLRAAGLERCDRVYGDLREVEGERWRMPFRWPGQFEDPDSADRFDCLNQRGALVSNSMGDT